MDRLITVEVFGVSGDEAKALFDRVADAAHALDESVTCSMGPLEEDDDDE